VVADVNEIENVPAAAFTVVTVNEAASVPSMALIWPAKVYPVMFVVAPLTLYVRVLAKAAPLRSSKSTLAPDDDNVTMFVLGVLTSEAGAPEVKTLSP
jgi:hypothetical protein